MSNHTTMTSNDTTPNTNATMTSNGTRTISNPIASTGTNRKGIMAPPKRVSKASSSPSLPTRNTNSPLHSAEWDNHIFILPSKSKTNLTPTTPTTPFPTKRASYYSPVNQLRGNTSNTPTKSKFNNTPTKSMSRLTVTSDSTVSNTPTKPNSKVSNTPTKSKQTNTHMPGNSSTSKPTAAHLSGNSSTWEQKYLSQLQISNNLQAEINALNDKIAKLELHLDLAPIRR
ncbi:hypothetical protein BC833DRAFT_586216 [Globomyces pollinis-pini]|nr:hypothetical protein BC833DRAFT_586216 [Globomyces pollinis-pini]